VKEEDYPKNPKLVKQDWLFFSYGFVSKT